MKTLPKLLRLTLFGIAVTSLVCVQPAQAFTVTIGRVGSNVVATGSGAINLTGLNFDGSGQSVGNGIQANAAVIFMSPGLANTDSYTGFTGPTSFGSGVSFENNSFSGDFFGIFGSGPGPLLILPRGYVSGAALSNSMTFDNATLASLGLTPGTYVWSWGTGLPNQNFTLIIYRYNPTLFALEHNSGASA